MDNMKVKDYLKDNDYLSCEITKGFYLWIDKASGEYCVEITYNKYDSYNINHLFDVDVADMLISDVKEKVINFVFRKYFYVLDKIGK